MAEYPLSYSLDGRGGEGKASVSGEALSVSPSSGEPIYLSLRDILGISPADYKVSLALPSGTLVLSGLGYRYEDFVRELSKKRNELTLKDMLMADTLKMGGVTTSYSYTPLGGKESKGTCEARVYETSLVILPDSGELVRLPFCELAEMKQDGFAIILTNAYGDSLTLSAMGRLLDPFRKALSDADNALSLKAQALLKDAAPDVAPPLIAKAARLMKDGKAASRKDLDAISPSLWAGLQKKIEAAGLKDEYASLERMAQKDAMCIGIKRSLMGDMEGEYVWFLAPIRSRNAVAMEATSAEGSGKATYIFRVMDRAAFQRKPDSIGEGLPAFLAKVNRCMIGINFRREPIYVSDDQLGDPKYSGYRFSIARLDALRDLRSLFIGRVIHNESWQKNLDALLSFSEKSGGRWKGEESE
ncbi:MAG: hypothetical protein U0R44_01745 [Candidatus Micrarchaeia archaeon]